MSHDVSHILIVQGGGLPYGSTAADEVLTCQLEASCSKVIVKAIDTSQTDQTP
jgi:hypothetical protein